MSIARLLVEQAGPITTIQEGGRTGYMRYGVPHSGPIDRLAFAAAHAALGNPPGSALVELSLGGISLICEEGQVDFALCGADFSAELDGVRLGPWSVASLGPGSRLRVREGAAGNWAYLAFAGQLNAEKWLESRATHLLAALGGGLVQPGRQLTIDPARSSGGARPLPPPPDAAPIARAAIVPGPQERYFGPDAINNLAAGTYSASARFDRMGRLLDGAPLVPTKLDMISEPAVRGSLQVDGEGRLTILLADHQTTGGYPKIATAAGAHVDRIAQLAPGASLEFDLISVEAAAALWREHAERTNAYLNELQKPPGEIGTRLLSANLIDGIFDARYE